VTGIEQKTIQLLED